MTNVAKRARRLLAGAKANAPDEKVYPNYVSFEDGARPTWWREGLFAEAWGLVLGVHELRAGDPSGAIIVTEDGLAVIDDHGSATWMQYVDIAGWDALSKEPLSMSLHVRRKSGSTVELEFPLPGQAFAFVQFLGRAIWEHSRTTGATAN